MVESGTGDCCLNMDFSHGSLELSSSMGVVAEGLFFL